MNASALFDSLISSPDPLRVGTALLLCSRSVLEKAVSIADDVRSFSRVNIGTRTIAYSVRSGNGQEEYIVVVGKYCSCPFFLQHVIKTGLAQHWTCKHELALRLRLALDANVEGFPENPHGLSLLKNLLM